MAEGMRNMHSGIYISVVQDIVGYTRWDPEDTTKEFTTEQWQITVRMARSEGLEANGSAKTSAACGQEVKVRAREYPNCIEVYGRESDEDMKDTQVKVEDTE